MKNVFQLEFDAKKLTTVLRESVVPGLIFAITLQKEVAEAYLLAEVAVRMTI